MIVTVIVICCYRTYVGRLYIDTCCSFFSSLVKLATEASCQRLHI